MFTPVPEPVALKTGAGEALQGDRDRVCQWSQARVERVVAYERLDHGHRVAAGTPFVLASPGLNRASPLRRAPQSKES